MKKKILLIISMFIFITNVKALTFDVNLTNIEDKGNNGTVGSITSIDVTNRSLDALFQNVGDEVDFDLTITNSGDKAGTLKSISITSTNDKIEYTHNLPENGLSIDASGTNKVTITAKTLSGATNGTSSSTIKLTYNYDEGSCPDGEILSDDETICSCPEGKVRNENGICIEPPKNIECEDDEIYNETKKICEKKVVPTPTPTEEPTVEKEEEPKVEEKKEEVVTKPVVKVSNPNTLDNIILISLLFLVSGLGIFAALFKRLKTNKSRIKAGALIGVITFGLTFNVLVSVFGIGNLLSAIINPVTKSKEITVTVNETIDMLTVWDGYCSKTTLTPADIFDGGSGTEADPYRVKNADQLACFAKSVNNGTTYEGKFVKQTRNIILNEDLNENINNGTTDGLHVWTPIGNSSNSRSFNGTYDGDNKTISGLYLNDSVLSGATKGLFGYASNATLKNIRISDAYSTASNAGTLLGSGVNSLIVDNVITSGNELLKTGYNYYNENRGGVIGTFNGNNTNAGIKIENTINNVNNGIAGVIKTISGVTWSEEPNVVFRNVTNNGYVSFSGGLAFVIEGEPNVLIENSANTGDVYSEYSASYQAGGLLGFVSSGKLTIKDSYNSGDVSNYTSANTLGGIGGQLSSRRQLLIENCFNSGNIRTVAPVVLEQAKDGVTIDELVSIKTTLGYSSWNDARVAGIVANPSSQDSVVIKNSYNAGELSGLEIVGGIVAMHYNANITYDSCYNIGDIYVGSYPDAGGIAGYTNGTIKDCHNSGNITVWSYRSYHSGMTGGLVGWGKDLAPNTTSAVDAVIQNSYNEGDILFTAKNNKANVAGLCAKCASITDSSNTGNINIKYATQSYDGIRLEGSGAITNTTFTGTITLQNLTY